MYNLGLYIYILFVRIAAFLGYGKAISKLSGHKDIFAALDKGVRHGERYVWFNVSSRGGFEQSRPVLERMRATHPEFRVVLTFFSPSGYEMAKNYQLADVVCFIPFDTRNNVRRFLDKVQPEMAFFVKCEYWQNFLLTLKARSVPVYSISSVFRKERLRYRVVTRRLRVLLGCFKHFYVQDKPSEEYLRNVGVDCVTVVGDTRFDRSVRVLEQARLLPLLELFADGKPLIVAGGSEKEDEAVYMPYFNKKSECKLVIAPNCVCDECIRGIERQYKGRCVRYTRASLDDVKEAGCIIIDCYGLLPLVYSYATIAYVGGGFGKGVHNVLEAAVYGVPVLVGPENRRSIAAQELKKKDGAVEVHDTVDFYDKTDMLLADIERRERAGKAAKRYVQENVGATARIFDSLKL